MYAVTSPSSSPENDRKFKIQETTTGSAHKDVPTFLEERDSTCSSQEAGRTSPRFAVSTTHQNNVFEANSSVNAQLVHQYYTQDPPRNSGAGAHPSRENELQKQLEHKLQQLKCE